MKKLGLYAIPFGFGPVSKAVAIARAINDIMDVEWYLIGNGISMEFMRREGIDAKIIQINDKNEDEAIETLSKNLDGAVVLMDNHWANSLALKIPVFFADSLGFMWSKSDFDNFPNMKNIAKYYVQDMFDSYDNLKQVGIESLQPVPAIVDLRINNCPELEKRDVVHLGGLLNPITPLTTETYLEGIIGILNRMDLDNPLLLMSEKSRTTFDKELKPFDARSLIHADGLGAIANSHFTWSSPGLTTILEMAKLGVNTAPLPPQNYSQALNIRNMVKYHGDSLHDIWHFLAEEYKEILPKIPEEEGVNKITELNALKLNDNCFISNFVDLAHNVDSGSTKLPQNIGGTGNGAKIIAEDIREFYS